MEVELLKAKLESEKQKQDMVSELQNNILHMKSILEQSHFTVDRFKHNT